MIEVQKNFLHCLVDKMDYIQLSSNKQNEKKAAKNHLFKDNRFESTIIKGENKLLLKPVCTLIKRLKLWHGIHM